MKTALTIALLLLAIGVVIALLRYEKQPACVDNPAFFLRGTHYDCAAR